MVRCERGREMARSRGSAMCRLGWIIGVLMLLVGWLPAAPAAAVRTQDVTFGTPVELFGQANDNAGAPTVTEGKFSVFSAAAAKVGSAFSAGKVYVSYDNGLTWTGPVTLTEPTPTTGDIFGTSLAIVGNTLAVGAEGTKVGALTGAGTTYIYHLDPASGAVTLQQTLTAPTPHARDGFGSALAFSSDATRLFVGALNNTLSGIPYVDYFTLSGGVYVFQSEVSGAASSDFGVAIATPANGSGVLVGAQFANSQAGQVSYVPVGQNGQFGVPVLFNLNPAPAPNAIMGSLVSLSKDGATAVVGGRADRTAYVMHSTDGGLTWTQQSTFGLPDNDFPSATSIVCDPTGGAITVLLGDTSADDGATPLTGAVVPFALTTNPPTAQNPLFAPDPATGDFFGQGVGVGPVDSNGTFNFTVGAIGPFPSTGKMYIYSGQAPIILPITLLPPTLPGGTPGTQYSQQITAIGGTGPYIFAKTAGLLPIGLHLDPNTGLISGTPITSGDSTFTITATDQSTGKTGSQQYTISIANEIVFLTQTLPSGNIAVNYSEVILLAGGSSAYDFTVSGNVPPGLTVLVGRNQSFGTRIEGTPTAQGTYTFTVTATDHDNQSLSKSQQYTVVIGPPAVTKIQATCYLPQSDIHQPPQQLPDPAMIKSGQVINCFATATYSDGSQKDVTATFPWTTSNPNVATVDVQGNVTVASGGTVTITSTAPPRGDGTIVTGQTTVTVMAGTAVGVAPVSAPQNRPAGTTSQPNTSPAPVPNPIPTGR
jgi:hypothetical protein